MDGQSIRGLGIPAGSTADDTVFAAGTGYDAGERMSPGSRVRTAPGSRVRPAVL
jgi:hypothetical protein